MGRLDDCAWDVLLLEAKPHDDSDLSLAACRRLLGTAGADLSDADVIALRDQLRAIADCMIDRYKTDREIEAGALRGLCADARQVVEERAAVLEFDAHLPRRAALQRALASHSRTADR